MHLFPRGFCTSTAHSLKTGPDEASCTQFNWAESSGALFWLVLSSSTIQQFGCNPLHGWLITEASGADNLCNIHHLRCASPVNVKNKTEWPLCEVVSLLFICPWWSWPGGGSPGAYWSSLLGSLFLIDRTCCLLTVISWCTIRAGRSCSMVGLYTARLIRRCLRGLS